MLKMHILKKDNVGEIAAISKNCLQKKKICLVFQIFEKKYFIDFELKKNIAHFKLNTVPFSLF